jgi:flagellar biogenesis protein FliO
MQDARCKTQEVRGKIFSYFLLLTFYFLLSTEAQASQNYLQNVKVYKNSDELRVKIDFSSPVKTEPIPSFYEKSIQLDLPDVYINPSKRVFDIEDGMLKHIYALQYSKDNVRLRLVLTQNGITLKENLSLTRNNNNLIIAIKKTPVAIHQSPAASEISKPEFPELVSEAGISESEQVIEMPPLINNIQPDIKPVMDKTGEKNPESRTPNPEPRVSKSDYLKYNDPAPIDPPDISSAVIKTAAALAIVLAAVMIISYIAKKFLKKNDIVFGKDKLVRVLGTSYIGVKKAITLLDVAGEVLVVAVSNNNITMLTKLDSEEAKSKLLNSSFDNPPTPPFNKGGQGGLGKDDMVAQITKTIQEKVRNLKRIQ